MKLYKQICTIDQARKLKELGIIQKGIYTQNGLSRFTVAELGVMINFEKVEMSAKYRPWIYFVGGYSTRPIYSKLEAKGRADVLIRQLENGTVTSQQANKRLLK